eukprot:COSAG02_NODE_30018_length_558_cov_2.117647_1_plen_140_part_01
MQMNPTWIDVESDLASAFQRASREDILLHTAVRTRAHHILTCAVATDRCIAGSVRSQVITLTCFRIRRIINDSRLPTPGDSRLPTPECSCTGTAYSCRSPESLQVLLVCSTISMYESPGGLDCRIVLALVCLIIENQLLE